jgi:hypothetical protein
MPPNRIVSRTISSKGAAARSVTADIGREDAVMPIAPPFGHILLGPVFIIVFGRLLNATGQQNVTRRPSGRQRDDKG